MFRHIASYAVACSAAVTDWRCAQQCIIMITEIVGGQGGDGGGRGGGGSPIWQPRQSITSDRQGGGGGDNKRSDAERLAAPPDQHFCLLPFQAGNGAYVQPSCFCESS